MRWWIILIAFGLLLILVVSDDRNRTALGLTSAAGTVEEGEKFGVRIGMSVEEANERVQAGGFRRLSFRAESEPASCGGPSVNRVIEDHEAARVYVDDSWRRGALCLISRDDQVVAIVWSYCPLCV